MQEEPKAPRPDNALLIIVAVVTLGVFAVEVALVVRNILAGENSVIDRP